MGNTNDAFEADKGFTRRRNQQHFVCSITEENYIINKKSNERQWLKAIVTDDTISMKRLLSADASLLNARLPQNCHETDGLVASKFESLYVTVPLNTAMSTLSHNAVQFLLENDCDVTMLEKGGYNVFHVLVIMGFLFPEREEKYHKLLLQLLNTIPGEISTNLLLEECNKGMRPLETAIQHNMFKLSLTILSSSSVYVLQTRQEGAYIAKTFDITEYETTRREMSPLYGLIFIDKKSLQSKYADKFFHSGFIQMWLQAKLRQNFPMIILWLLLRLVYVVMFFTMTVVQYHDYSNFANYTVNPRYVNVTNRPIVPAIFSREIRLFFFYYLLLFSAVIILYDVYDIYTFLKIRTYRYYDTFKSRKEHVITHMFYRISQFILAISVFLLFFNGLQPWTSFSLEVWSFLL